MHGLSEPHEHEVAFSILLYPFGTKGKDGHSAATQIVSGLLFRLQSRAHYL